MIFEHTSYRQYLRDVLASRIQKNPSYSLRAMARSLGLAQSQLSEVMSGKANLSIARALRVTQSLQLEPTESDYFCWLLQLEVESDPRTRDALLSKVSALRQAQSVGPIHDLTIDQFKQISDWYHSAILELPSLKHVELNAEGVASALGISKLDAQVAIDRLVRLDLLEPLSPNRYRRVHPTLQVRSEVPNSALRTFYRQMFEKASSALDTQTPSERLSGYETLAFSPEALPEVKDALEQFFQQVLRISKKYPEKRAVYHLLVHFFELTQKTSRTKGKRK